MSVKSPCKLVCKYDEEKVCIGCRRTMEEIVNWPEYSDPERLLVLKRIRERRSGSGKIK